MRQSVYTTFYLSVILTCSLFINVDERVHAATPSPSTEMTRIDIQSIRQQLAVYAQERAEFNKNNTDRLLKAELINPHDKYRAAELQSAINYCWMVSKNTVRFNAAQKILTDTSRMGKERVDALDTQHLYEIKAVSEQLYEQASALPVKSDSTTQTISTEELENLQWARVTEHVLHERDISPFIDTIAEWFTKDRQKPYSFSRLVVLLFPYRTDKVFLQHVRKIIENSSNIDQLITQMATDQKKEPNKFKQSVLEFISKSSFDADYAATFFEIISLPIKPYVPELYSQLTALGTEMISVHTPPLSTHSLAILESQELPNGLVIQKIDRSVDSNILFDHPLHCFSTGHDFNVNDSPVFGKANSQNTDTYPLFTETSLAQFIRKKRSILYLTTASNMQALQPHLTSNSPLVWYLVKADNPQTAGNTLAANLSWLSVAYTDRESRLYGNVDSLSDLQPSTTMQMLYSNYPSEWRSTFIDTDKQTLRLVNASSVPYILTMVENANTEQLRNFFGPVEAIVLTGIGHNTLFMLSLKTPTPVATSQAFLKSKPLGLSTEFLHAVYKRQLACHSLFFGNIFEKHMNNGASYKAGIDTLLDTANVTHLNHRRAIYFLLLEQARSGGYKDALATAQKILLNTETPLNQRIDKLFKQYNPY